MKVRDSMRLGVLTCSPETPAEEVAGTLRLHDVSALVVTDADGYVVGLVSRSDLVDAAFVPRGPRHWRAADA